MLFCVDVKFGLTLGGECRLLPLRRMCAHSWSKIMRNLFFSWHIIRVVRLRGVRLVAHVAHMGRMKNAYRNFVGS